MADAPFRILVAEPLSQDALQRLSSVGDVIELSTCDEASLLNHVIDCDALVVRTYSQVTSAVINAAKKLKVIGRAGIGVENIDTAAAAAAGVTVVHTPASSTQAVAELTLGLMIALERKVLWCVRQVREDRFLEARGSLSQRQLGDLVLGIVGFGRIGQRVACIAHAAFGMRIIFNDIREIRTHLVPAAAVSKEKLFAQADVISLHVPLTAETKHMINADVLATLKPDALLINTARGAVVDGEALAQALTDGRVAGAAIDVFEPEPPPPDHPLLGAPNCILTPHIGSRTVTALAAMNDVVDDVIAVLEDRSPRYPYLGTAD